MALRTRRQDSATGTEHSIRATNTRLSHGPLGAPKASEVKEVLLTLKTRLQVQLEGGDADDPAMVRALRGNIRCQLEQINVALARIDEGKYGMCADCLKSIEAERLVVRPYSTLCLGCQNRQDQSKGARIST